MSAPDINIKANMAFYLKKELKESISHGTKGFPLASYSCTAAKYDINIGMHWHPEFEINRFCSGSFIFNYAMRDYEIEGPCIALVPGNVLHNVLLKKGSSQSSVVFNPKMLDLSFFDAALSDIRQFFSVDKSTAPKFLTPDMECFLQADSDLSYIIDNASSEKASTRLRVKAKLLDLLALMYESGIFIYESSLKTEGFENRQDKLKTLLSYVNENYAKKISMNDAAAFLDVSQQYFCRYFKKSTGMSFVDFLNDLRLRRASQEILLTSKSMQSIATDNGFENIGYFFKLFKQKYGHTPRAYRLINSEEDK